MQSNFNSSWGNPPLQSSGAPPHPQQAMLQPVNLAQQSPYFQHVPPQMMVPVAPSQFTPPSLNQQSTPVFAQAMQVQSPQAQYMMVQIPHTVNTLTAGQNQHLQAAVQHPIIPYPFPPTPVTYAASPMYQHQQQQPQQQQVANLNQSFVSTNSFAGQSTFTPSASTWSGGMPSTSGRIVSVTRSKPDAQPDLRLMTLPDPTANTHPQAPLANPNADLPTGEPQWTELSMSTICKEFLSGRCTRLSATANPKEEGTANRAPSHSRGRSPSSMPGNHSVDTEGEAACMYVHLPPNVRAFPQEVCRDWAKQLPAGPTQPLSDGDAPRCKRTHCRMYHGPLHELESAREMLLWYGLSRSSVFVRLPSISPDQHRQEIFRASGKAMNDDADSSIIAAATTISNGADLSAARSSFAITSLSQCVLVFARKSA